METTCTFLFNAFKVSKVMVIYNSLPHSLSGDATCSSRCSICSTFKGKKKTKKKKNWTKIWKNNNNNNRTKPTASPIDYRGSKPKKFSKKKKKNPNTEQITKSEITSKSKATKGLKQT